MNGTIKRIACPHDCPDTCAIQVQVEDGVATRIRGDPAHPFTRGFLCTKVSRYLERVYSSERLLYPLRRAGRKGEGRFVRISWEEALSEIAERLRAIAASDEGPQAILPYSYAGTQGIIQGASMDRRFFHRLGASLLDRTICATAGLEGYRITIGRTVGTDPESVRHARLIVAWGANILTTNVHQWPFIREARRKGARLVVIDPYRSRTAAQADLHLAVRPGTDAALALGMMHVLINEGLVDRAYVDAYTVGYEALVERVQAYPPERVAAITGLAAGEIRAFAREYGTTRPSFIRLLLGLQRHGGGGMAVRTIACLPALVGAWRDCGGGMLFTTGGFFPYNGGALQRPDFIPPGTRVINMSRLGAALAPEPAEIGWPPVRALVVYNSNPAAIAPDQAAVLRGLRREDLFTVVLEQFPTDTTDYADIVLPVTTALEHFDLVPSWGHLYLTLSEPAIAPPGECLPNTEIFRRLAARMGFTDPAFCERDEELAAKALKTGSPFLKGITLDRLRQTGYVRVNAPPDYRPFAEGGFYTPSGKCEFYSEAEARRGRDPLPAYVPPHECAERDPALAARYPLQLLTPKAHHFLNSTFSAQPSLRRAEGRPTLEIHAIDAAARGIQDGALVRIFNARGEFAAHAALSERVQPGVVVAPAIWWNKLSPNRHNGNVTTSQALTDLGGGATFFDNLVEVAPWTADGLSG